MIKEIDYQGNGQINWSEFLAATVDTAAFLTEQRLKAIFQQFDTDDSGCLTSDNIKYAFQKLGQNFSAEEVDEMLKTHDIKGNNVIDFEEFKEIFFE